MSPFKAALDDPAGTAPLCADIVAVEGPADGVAEVEKREGELTSFTDET